MCFPSFTTTTQFQKDCFDISLKYIFDNEAKTATTCQRHVYPVLHHHQSVLRERWLHDCWCLQLEGWTPLNTQFGSKILPKLWNRWGCWIITRPNLQFRAFCQEYTLPCSQLGSCPNNKNTFRNTQLGLFTLLRAATRYHSSYINKGLLTTSESGPLSKRLTDGNWLLRGRITLSGRDSRLLSLSQHFRS